MQAYIDPPSQFTGNELGRIGQIYTYLYKLHEQLNLALNKLDSGELSVQGQQQITKVVKDATAATELEQINTLRSMIVKNANYVAEEMDSIANTLQSNYVAQSEFGEYQQTVQTTYVQNSLYEEQNTLMQESIDGLTDYRTTTEGHIRYGIIGENDGVYDYGIAIAEQIEVEAVEGEDVDRIVTKDFLAVYTANRLEFRQGGNVLATFEGDALDVGTINVAGSIVQGNDWKWDSSNGLALFWVGDE